MLMLHFQLLKPEGELLKPEYAESRKILMQCLAVLQQTVACQVIRQDAYLNQWETLELGLTQDQTLKTLMAILNMCRYW